jgi:3-dehydroquinate synthase
VTAREVALPTYDVSIGTGIMRGIGEIVEQAAPAHRYAIITDSNVGPRYARDVSSSLGSARTSVFTIAAGEEHKTRDTWSQLTDELLGAGFGRDTTIIALGGGVVGDVAGFVAATFMRGIPYVQVPTSLLAMIDASVGGKTGVDTPAGKNLVGAFHQPAAVVADTATLTTLPAEHLRAGFAEAIKHGVIADAAYFDAAAKLAANLDAVDVDGSAMLDVVARSIEIKANIVGQDERESGIRKTLNFGHTIGHAIELCSNYQILHGAAVATGMVYEARLAEMLGIAENGTAHRIRDAVAAAQLPVAAPSPMSIEQIVRASRTDKKARAGRVEYALPVRIGTMNEAGGRWAAAVDDESVMAAISRIAS